MRKQFKREQRYFVVKVKDAKEYLDTRQLEKLAEIADTILEGREKDGIPAVECVVVESDWPEYEPTWKAIEARVTGAQPAQKAVAYLDLGAGGYMDIGTDLNDEQLASLPKGRHMLGIVGTYGVDGYVSAQPAHSIPEGWLRAIDEALVVAHIGVANESDTYEQAKAKLNNLIGFHVDVATDPAVNGGYKLVPIEPTETFYQCFSAYDGTSYSNPFDRDEFLKDWRAALAASPEAKP